MRPSIVQISVAICGLLAGANPARSASLAQQAYLKASNTGAGDRFGWGVAVSGDTLVVGAPWEASSARGVNGNQADNSLPYSGAVYVFVRSGTNWSQQAYLKASNTGRDDGFGIVVAISGDTLVVGADGEDSSAAEVNGNQNDNTAPNAGAAYVFVRNGTNWSQQAYLKASYNAEQNRFGRAVAMSGDTVVIGTYAEADFTGAAYVFVRDGTNWTEQARLTGSNTEPGDRFGSVGISGDTIVVGATGEDSSATGIDGDQNDNSASDAGAAYVFVRDGTTWSQQAYLKASNAEVGDSFGRVAISGDTIVVGAGSEASGASGVNADQSNNSAGGAGAAYVFVRSGTTWTQQAYLKASNAAAADDFGDVGNVAVSGDTIVVGASLEASAATGVDGDQTDNTAPQSGAAYVFKRSGSNWSQQAYLKASNTETGDGFGMVAVSGDTVVVGALYESSNATGINGNQTNNSAPAAGAAYVFAIAVVAPQLSIIQNGAQALICWPVGATNYVLEAATSLPAISWATVTNTPTVTATNRSMQLPLTGTTKFFRLRKP